MSKRNYYLKISVIMALIFQIVNAVYGLVLPKLYLTYYGSEINGLVSSITQYLSLISFCELGVGAVVQSALYKPLAKKDNDAINGIMAESRHFFKGIAIILALYVIAIVFLYPKLSSTHYSFFTTTCLILATAINLFSQYYFGLANQLLLNADQKVYINYVIQIVTTVATAVCSATLIIKGFSIELVKIISSLVLLLRPVMLSIYVKRNYSIKPVASQKEWLTQKWNGMAQHIAHVVVDQTDVVVLTAFSTLINVSIYHVYYMVVLGIRQLLIYASSGVQSMLGNVVAIENENEIKRIFGHTEWLFHNGCTLLFAITAVLIVPFIRVYTNNISDAQYILPIFAYLIVAAQFAYCIRQPYIMLVKAVGHYKETQTSAIIEAVLNITLSIVLVKVCGLIGVAIGTIVAMGYRTLYLVLYIKQSLINRTMFDFWKLIILDICIIGCSFFVCGFFDMNSISYYSWILLAFKCSAVCLLICLAFNYLFYFESTNQVIKKLLSKMQNGGLKNDI